jgi:hypothetical protein
MPEIPSLATTWPLCEDSLYCCRLRALAVRINGADPIRQDILDIAAELENQ